MSATALYNQKWGGAIPPSRQESFMPQDILSSLEGGDFALDLEREIKEVSQMVKTIKKAGAVNVSFKISPVGEHQVDIEGKIDGKPPKFSRGRSLFYVNEATGEMRPESWKQVTLNDLRALDDPQDSSNLKEISE